ncbi:hypothetical protein ISN44_As02g031900 [Arabidopsis suecica]|uniref:Uncharacterized protein n=1 Tax=Arabidopsis suecica TaxID=45249 RepID=A0A8T2G9F7_ARASU|nr:hypothetical protein ISN44_As02g031900 [Arabidopsis suecica]
MSFSDDCTSPSEKNRARTSQEPRERPQDLSFLSSKVARDGIEITMMPIPRLVNNAPQWTIKKRLTEHNVNPTYGQLRLPRSFFEQQIRGHLPEADLQKRTHC